MAEAVVDKAEVLNTISAVKALLAKLEARLTAAAGKASADPYKRRRELLQRVYWAGNNVAREELFAVLEAAGTNSRWIGQQVKIGYLSVIPVPGGSARYAVTPKAVRELELGKGEEEETTALARLAEPSFAEDWDSPEDSAYDNL